jgi:hypothetical protein
MHNGRGGGDFDTKLEGRNIMELAEGAVRSSVADPDIFIWIRIRNFHQQIRIQL